MKFKALGDCAPDERMLETDYENAERFWKVRLSRDYLYSSGLFQTAYIPLSQLSRAFIRVQSVVSHVCCGPMEFNNYFMILCKGDQEIASIELDSEVKADRLLAAIGACGVKTGKPEKEADA